MKMGLFFYFKMRSLTTILFITAVLLFIGYFIITMVASYFAITEGWGISLLVYYAGLSSINLFVPIIIRLKADPTKYSNSLNILTIMLSVIVIFLIIKGVIGVSQEIELYNTIKNFSN